MSFMVVIPARYDSARLPGKPLLAIAGKPMLQRVWEQASMSSAARIVIATDDQRIAALAQSFGAELCMTRKDHASGTDRLQEVAVQLALPSDQILVNVQGDEPLIPPQVIDQVAQNLENNPDAGVATLIEPIESLEDFLNPNVVKVARDYRNFALNFSRAPMPWPRDDFGGAEKHFSNSVAGGASYWPVRLQSWHAQSVCRLAALRYRTSRALGAVAIYLSWRQYSCRYGGLYRAPRG